MLVISIYPVAQAQNKFESVPGGVAIINIPIQLESKPNVTFSGRKVLVMQKNKQNWQAIIGLPLTLKPDKYFINIHIDNNKVKKIPFIVKDKNYPTEHLRITNQNLVTPDNKSLKRIANESKVLIESYNKFTPYKLDDLNMSMPVKGRISSPFGLKRFINGTAKNPHRGFDIAAPLGTPIVAPKAGKVILIGNFFYSGNIVCIDHGEGFISSYSHLDKVETTEGTWLKEGDLIGTVGSTGRVTGPHLHLAVCLNGNLIDPSLFLIQN